MMKHTEFTKRIKQAKTSEELHKISDEAFENCNNREWEKVIDNCIIRELELGICPRQEQITRENGGKLPKYI